MRCPYCNSEKIVKGGSNPQLRKDNGIFVIVGQTQKWYCNSCHRRTTKPVNNVSESQ